MGVTERDATTIGDSVAIHAYGAARDNRGRKLTAPRTYSTNAVWPAGAEVWSYGSHFPLYRFVHETGRRPLFVLNGDRWGGSRSRTPDHQAAARAAIAATSIDSCVIPFTALDGAGIDKDSIRLIHARPDENWTEDRSAETLAGVPLWERTVHYQVTLESETLAGVADRHRRVHRELSDTEVETVRAAGGYVSDTWKYSYADRLPDADGIYRWTEPRTRPLAPGEDGRFHWTAHVHRLGDCLFSAVREIREPDRAAEPFESERHTARETLELIADGGGGGFCRSAPEGDRPLGHGIHEAGPSGACIHCGYALTVRAVWRRRARYLSSFDTNETPPLYFLAEVPRGAGGTVETATEALAPRAVHAALARGAEVLRQGDIFLIPTNVTAPELVYRGIRSRARLTQWTRGARARKGETGYSEPMRAADWRRARALARREYRAGRAALAAAPEPNRPKSEPNARRLWQKIRADHAERLARARAELRRATFRASLYGIQSARRTLENLETRGAVDSWGNRNRRHARDSYRRNAVPDAASRWRLCLIAAHERLRPELYGVRAEAMRERIRAAVSIYGTAHSASEVITLRSGAVYVRGTVRHVPALDLAQPAWARGRRPDHRPTVLGNGERWYLAVRNTVPRQAVSRRRRRSNRARSAA